MNIWLFRSARKVLPRPWSAPKVPRARLSRPRAGEAGTAAVCHDVPVTFDDATTAALRAYAQACDALDAATDDGQVLHLSDMKALAALNLRKALTAAGWSAPARDRSSR